MCGISGFLGGNHDAESLLRQMGGALISRGPDDSGIWFDIDSQIGISHQRLSVIDLSSNGRQPMVSTNDRYVIAFNGEIYNHVDLKSRLKNIIYRGGSDTEVLLNAINEWGMESALKEAIGMFAFVLWDKKERELYLARDRIGEKPLYYGWQGKGGNASFLFGSELKSIKLHPSFCSEINRDSIANLLQFNYIPSPRSIYNNIHKLEAGSFLRVSLEDRCPQKKTYWSSSDVIQFGISNPFAGSDDEALDNLESLLTEAVGSQMLSDVPVGAFLSGGVDSSLVVALMKSQSMRQIKTFSIGYSDQHYNEATYAKEVAKYLGTDHSELYISHSDALGAIPMLPELYSEPFSDSSQIPTYLLSKLAREHVTVSLSGDGGDELFCGYNRYRFADGLWSKISLLPAPLRSFISYAIKSFSQQSLNKIADFVPGMSRFNNVGEKLHKGASVLNSHNIRDFYLQLISHFNTPEAIVIGCQCSAIEFDRNIADISGMSDVQWMMALDFMNYLPDDILVKVDRASMGVSLETRVPFLDHRVVEFAWRLPQSMKLRNGQTKWLLRQLLYRHVPKQLIDRPKMGFGVPIDSWLRGPLRDWAEDLLDESRLRNEGYFNIGPIQKMWNEHVSGRRNWQHHIWNILMFQAWLENNNG